LRQRQSLLRRYQSAEQIRKAGAGREHLRLDDQPRNRRDRRLVLLGHLQLRHLLLYPLVRDIRHLPRTAWRLWFQALRRAQGLADLHCLSRRDVAAAVLGVGAQAFSADVPLLQPASGRAALALLLGLGGVLLSAVRRPGVLL